MTVIILDISFSSQDVIKQNPLDLLVRGSSEKYYLEQEHLNNEHLVWHSLECIHHVYLIHKCYIIIIIHKLLFKYVYLCMHVFHFHLNQFLCILFSQYHENLRTIININCLNEPHTENFHICIASNFLLREEVPHLLNRVLNFTADWVLMVPCRKLL